MNGFVKTIIPERSFGFIQVSDSKTEYFFHRDDFTGHWDDLKSDVKSGKLVPVTFELAQSPKGPRAADVKRTDWPNEAA